MDLKGSLVDTKIRIIPSETLVKFLKSISAEVHSPTTNIYKLIHGTNFKNIPDCDEMGSKVSVHLSNDDMAVLNKITKNLSKKQIESKKNTTERLNNEKDRKDGSKDTDEKDLFNAELYLEISDLEWLYTYLQKERSNANKEVPYLHALLEGSEIKLPENRVLKRNPDLEARCVKLRSQQEARDYRKMTKTVDNVRMTFPEDSISYQLKHLNRQLIAVGQFIISIFAGFMFGFRGIEWMVGNLDFGFRLLLGVMCALVIALAEIYFLAKQLNEEYFMPETIQLGGPPKFANQDNIPKYANDITKEHVD